MPQNDTGPEATPPKVEWAPIPTAEDEKIEEDLDRLKKSEEIRVAQPRAAARSSAAKNKRDKRGWFVSTGEKKETKAPKVVAEFDSVGPRILEVTAEDHRPVRFDLRFHKPRGRGRAAKTGRQGIPSAWLRNRQRKRPRKSDGRDARREERARQIFDRDDESQAGGDAAELPERSHAGSED